MSRIISTIYLAVTLAFAAHHVIHRLLLEHPR